MNEEAFLGFSPTAWIAAFTVVLVVVATIQACIYAAIHRTTKTIERAYVDMSHLSPGLENVGDGHIPTVTIAIKNHGRTPGTVIRNHVQLDAGLERLPPTPDYRDILNSRAEEFILMPGERIKMEPGLYEGLPPGDPTNMNIWLIGYVDYMDRFERQYRSGYARRYDHTRATNNLVIESQQGYNYDKQVGQPLSRWRRWLRLSV